MNDYPKVSEGILGEQDTAKTNTEKFLALVGQYFPEAIKDGEVDFTALKEEMGEFAEVGSEHYDFTWAGKQAAKKEALGDIFGKTLKYKPEDSLNPDTTENLYIEGDNLEALKLLRRNYHGKIKMIYIDPPYNTGSDFIYHDDYSMTEDELAGLSGDVVDGVRFQKNSKDSARYHTNWLNMIYPRLKVARELLSDDGVIFISIDDNEQENLKKICDEVFGESCFEADFVIKVRHEKRILRDDIRYQSCIEHIICYSKPRYIPNRLPKENNEDENYCWNIEIFSYPQKIIEIGGYKIEVYGEKSWKAIKKNNGQFKEYQIRGSLISQKGSASEFYELYLRNLRDEDGNGTLYKVIGMGEKGDGLGYRFIRHPYDLSHKNGFYYQGRPINSDDSKGLPYPNYFDFVVESNNVGKEGGVEYKGGKKPVALIEKMIEISGINNYKNPLVMDFFSGSATLAHAIMKNNALFNNKIKYIMVQLPEDLDETYQKSSPKNKASIKNLINFLDDIYKPHFLTEIGKERIRRSAKEIHEENPDATFDDGFKVFTVSDTNIRWNNMNDEEIKSLAEHDYGTGNKDDIDFTPGHNDIDIVYEIMLRQYDIPLTTPIEKLDDISERIYIFADTVVVCLEPEITDDLVEKLAAIEPLPAKYVFRDSAFGDDIQFKDKTFRKLSGLIANYQIEEERKSKFNNYTVEFI